MNYYEEQETMDLIDNNISESYPCGELVNMCAIILYGIKHKCSIKMNKIIDLSLPKDVSIDKLLTNFKEEDVDFMFNYIESKYNDFGFKKEVKQLFENFA